MKSSAGAKKPVRWVNLPEIFAMEEIKAVFYFVRIPSISITSKIKKY